MSWLRDWLNRGKTSSKDEPLSSPPGEPATEPGFHIRDAERRQLRRLLKRRDDLEFDLQQALHALESENQWTERIVQLDDAISQATADRRAIEPVPDEHLRPQLQPVAVQITALREREPAEVTLQIDAVSITYREEIDWAERGHQVTIPELRRVDGDVDLLLPDGLEPEVEQELREHLRHSLATLVNEALEQSARGEVAPQLTLAELTTPCPDCGGWLDQKGRCPACTEINWTRQQIDQDLLRLRKEQDGVIQELERYRERLPIIQRQLAETDADIEKLQAKGVEPA